MIDIRQPNITAKTETEQLLQMRSYSAKADTDANGKAISGSKKEKVLQYINGLNLSYAQKDSLYYAFGWTQSKINEAPWH